MNKLLTATIFMALLALLVPQANAGDSKYRDDHRRYSHEAEHKSSKHAKSGYRLKAQHHGKKHKRHKRDKHYRHAYRHAKHHAYANHRDSYGFLPRYSDRHQRFTRYRYQRNSVRISPNGLTIFLGFDH